MFMVTLCLKYRSPAEPTRGYVIPPARHMMSYIPQHDRIISEIMLFYQFKCRISIYDPDAAHIRTPEVSNKGFANMMGFKKRGTKRPNGTPASNVLSFVYFVYAVDVLRQPQHPLYCYLSLDECAYASSASAQSPESD